MCQTPRSSALRLSFPFFLPRCLMPSPPSPDPAADPRRRGFLAYFFPALLYFRIEDSGFFAEPSKDLQPVSGHLPPPSVRFRLPCSAEDFPEPPCRCPFAVFCLTAEAPFAPLLVPRLDPTLPPTLAFRRSGCVFQTGPLSFRWGNRSESLTSELFISVRSFSSPDCLFSLVSHDMHV